MRRRRLCALEILAGDREISSDYVVIEIRIDDDVPRLVLDREDLPEGWSAEVHSESTRVIGGEWVRQGETSVLSVPSTVNAHERNYLLNPAHPDFPRIIFSDPRPFQFPDRLKRRR